MNLLISIGYLCIISWISSTADANSTCYSRESCLYDALMTNYNKNVRPVSAPGKSVDVVLDVDLLNILSLEEKNEVLDSVLKVRAVWNDHYLSWNASTYEIDEILLNVELLWLPDFAVVNSVEKFYQSTFLTDFRANIRNDGTVTWLFGGIFRTACSIDITHYPFDEQSCTIILENWIYKDIYVNLTTASFDISNADDNSLWFIKSESVTRSELDIDGSIYKKPVMTFTLNLKRKTSYYLLNIILPVILLCIGTLGVFWLPPDCGEKVSLGITVLLAFSVFQIVIMDITPVNSEETPYISKLVTYLMVLSTVSLLSSMLSVHIFFKSSSTRVPKLLRIVAFKGLAKIYCLSHAIPSSPKNSSVIVPENEVKEFDIDNEKGAFKASLGASVSGPQSDMEELLAELKKITSHLEDQEESDFITDEWKLLAVVIDRTLFVISLLIFIILIAASTNF